jgi:hypothetical protein
MDDFDTLHRSIQSFAVAHVGPDSFAIGQVGLWVIAMDLRQEIIKHHDATAIALELSRQPAANETGAAGNQNTRRSHLIEYWNVKNERR